MGLFDLFRPSIPPTTNVDAFVRWVVKYDPVVREFAANLSSPITADMYLQMCEVASCATLREIDSAGDYMRKCSELTDALADHAEGLKKRVSQCDDVNSDLESHVLYDTIQEHKMRLRILAVFGKQRDFDEGGVGADDYADR